MALLRDLDPAAWAGRWSLEQQKQVPGQEEENAQEVRNRDEEGDQGSEMMSRIQTQTQTQNSLFPSVALIGHGMACDLKMLDDMGIVIPQGR